MLAMNYRGPYRVRATHKPDPVIEAILTHRGPVLLDLDETLYLRNSTEDFIDSARPAFFPTPAALSAGFSRASKA